MNIERIPYDRRRIDALIAFCSAHPVSRVFSLPARRMLETLAAKDGVIELRVRGRIALVAVVVDGCENVYDAANLDVLGWDASVDLRALLAVAEPIALHLGARRACVSLALPLSLSQAVPDGWTPADLSQVMERPAGPWETPPLPPDAAWEDVRRAGLEEHYAAVRAAFADDPSTLIPEFRTFQVACLGSVPPVRVLRVGGVEAGFVRSAFVGQEIGEVASVGRIPAFRGRGLGPVLIAEALRILSLRRGLSLYRLGVTSANEAAVRLYTRTGFTVVERWQSWHR